MNKRIFKITWSQFKERRLRSALTILGIVIGITALVSLILLSNGLKAGITNQLDAFGADEILITAKASARGPPSGYGYLTTDDVKVLTSIPQILAVDSLLSTTATIEVGRSKVRMTVNGVGSEYGTNERTFEDFFNSRLTEGRYIAESGAKEVNIGYKLAYETFDKDILVGSTIKINDDKYRVVGIFEEQGNINKDNIIYAPIDSLRDTIGNSKALTSLTAKISPGADVDVMVEKIKNNFKRSRGKDDIGVITPKQLKDQINSLLGVIDIVVISIALISLFVGALGITNSMYTAVLQRVKEIGIMKAVGAKNSQILNIFLFESAMLGFFGGLAGTLLGILMSYGFIGVINSFGFFRIELIPDYALFISAIIFSTLLGIASGILPAIRASKLKVVDALRYE